MRESVEELLEESKPKRGLTVSLLLKFGAAVAVIVAVGVYIGNILFGTDSVEVLIDLQNKKENLKREVQRLKEENAALQKEYFELKQLEPE